MSVTQAYKTIVIEDRAAFVELQMAVLDYQLGIARAIRAKTAAGQPFHQEVKDLEAANRAVRAVMDAV